MTKPTATAVPDEFGRVTCQACRYLWQGKACTNHKQAGLTTRELAPEFTHLAQRCPGFQPKVGEVGKSCVGGTNCSTQKASAHKDRPQNQKQFAAETAAVTGQTEQTVTHLEQRYAGFQPKVGEVTNDLEVGKNFPLQVSTHGETRRHFKAFAAETATAPGQTK